MTSKREPTEKTLHTVLDKKVQLYKRKNSSRFWCRFSYKGAQYKSSCGTTVLKDAKRFAEDHYLETISRLKYGLTQRPIRFNEAADSYLEMRRQHVEAKGRSLKSFQEKQVSRIENYFKPYFNDKLIEKITEDDVQAYYGWRKTYWTKGPGKKKLTYSYMRDGKKVTTKTVRKAPTLDTINGEVGVLKAVLEHAIKKKWLEATKLPEFNQPTAKYGRRPSFEPQEIEQLSEYMQQQIILAPTEYKRLEAAAFEAMIDIAILTGIRPVEFEKLEWRMVRGRKDSQLYPFEETLDWKIDDINVRLLGVYGKTEPRYVVPVRSAAAPFIRLWEIWEMRNGKPPEADDPVLFNLKTSKRRDWPRSAFEKMLEACDLLHDAEIKKRSPYSLRHYAIREWLKQGIPWQDVAKNAGTSTKMLKEHYDHVTVEEHADRFEMMSEFNRMDDMVEMAKAVVDEMERRGK